MIAYLDTSLLLRAFLPDEDGHEQARALLADEDVVLVTGTWTRIEAAAAITRAARSARKTTRALLDAALATMTDEGPVFVVSAPAEGLEALAFQVAVADGLRAMDAWHLACALTILPALADADEQQAFATRDAELAAAARARGLLTI